MADGDSSDVDERGKPSPAASEPAQEFPDFRHYVPRDLLDVSFPSSVRGYDRGAVDAYVKRVNRVISELKVSASPPAAVRHALDQAGEKVDGLLQAAREAAEQITTSAREEAEDSAERVKAEAAKFLVDTSAEADRLKAEADELTAKARADADATVANAKAEAGDILTAARAEAETSLARSQAEADERLRRLEEELASLRAEAETRLREIQADTQAVWKEREEMLADIHAMANGLIDITDAAAARFQPHELAAPDEEKPKLGAGSQTEPTTVVADESAPAMPAAGSQGSPNESSK